jgi:hypothetical protein
MNLSFSELNEKIICKNHKHVNMLWQSKQIHVRYVQIRAELGSVKISLKKKKNCIHGIGKWK